jgi:hypothetical protein
MPDSPLLRETRASSAFVRDFAVVHRGTNDIETCVCRARRAVPIREHGGGMVLEGSVEFRSLAGERLTCREARVTFRDTIRVTAEHGRAHTSDGETPFEKAGFPFSALGGSAGIIAFVSAPVLPPPGPAP